MADTEKTVASKIFGIVVAGAAAWVAQKAITEAWKKATGHEPPNAEDDSDARIGEIVASAVLTGALVALARALATRGAARYMR